MTPAKNAATIFQTPINKLLITRIATAFFPWTKKSIQIDICNLIWRDLPFRLEIWQAEISSYHFHHDNHSFTMLYSLYIVVISWRLHFCLFICCKWNFLNQSLLSYFLIISLHSNSSTNQYLLIYNEENTLIDKMKWNGEKYVPISFGNFDSVLSSFSPNTI